MNLSAHLREIGCVGIAGVVLVAIGLILTGLLFEDVAQFVLSGFLLITFGFVFNSLIYAIRSQAYPVSTRRPGHFLKTVELRPKDESPIRYWVWIIFLWVMSILALLFATGVFFRYIEIDASG